MQRNEANRRGLTATISAAGQTPSIGTIAAGAGLQGPSSAKDDRSSFTGWKLDAMCAGRADHKNTPGAAAVLGTHHVHAETRPARPPDGIVASEQRRRRLTSDGARKLNGPTPEPTEPQSRVTADGSSR